MNEQPYFNPLKNYNNNHDGVILTQILSNVDRQVCFVGDDPGYFFSTCRRVGSPSISFSSEKYYNFFTLMKDDVYFLKRMFEKYLPLYKQELLEHFEKKIYTETHPYVQAFVLFVLCNSSLNINSDFSNFVKRDIEFLESKVKSLSKYFIGTNELYLNDIPDGCFVVSYEKDFSSHEGILISKRKYDHHIIAETDEHKYYYKEITEVA